MTNILSTLTRIEPTRGLIEYVEQTKPYHSKILDIEIEYVYRDEAVGTATEYETKHITETSPLVEVTYNTLGYGLVWEGRRQAATQYIVSDINYRTGDDVYNGPTHINLSNSFVIDNVTFPVVHAVLINTASNRFALATPYALIDSDPLTNSLTVQGNVVSNLTVGQSIHVNHFRSLGRPVNRSFTVQSVSLVGMNTVIVLVEPISPNAIYPGTVATILSPENLPPWIDHQTAVYVEPMVNGILPTPLVAQRLYYIVPSNIDGEFNLAYKRYPIAYTDYVDIRTTGLLAFNIQVVEPFTPGDQFYLDNTPNGSNNGKYTVKYVTNTAPNQYTIQVYEPIRHVDSVDDTIRGVIKPILLGYDDSPERELVSAPDLFARGRVFDYLQFEFSFSEEDSGAGTVDENPPIGGYSTSGFGDSPGWDDEKLNYNSITSPTTGMSVSPAGFDANPYSISAFDYSPINPTN